jgi:hypothetical protein
MQLLRAEDRFQRHRTLWNGSLNWNGSLKRNVIVRLGRLSHVLTSMQNVDTKPRVHPALSLPPGLLLSGKAMCSSMCRLPTRDRRRSSSRRPASLVGGGAQSVPPRRRYARHPSTPRLLRSTWVKHSTAPACIACTVIGISPWPVIKIMGMAKSAAASRCCSSSPRTPGSRTSSTRQLGPSGCRLRRNSYADVNAATRSPTDRRRFGEGRAPRRIIIDDADSRVSFGHNALAFSQERPRHDSALWRRACRPPPSAADLSRRPRPARHRPCVPGLLVRSDRVVDVTLPASVWERGRATQRERRRGRHRAVVGPPAASAGKFTVAGMAAIITLWSGQE